MRGRLIHSCYLDLAQLDTRATEDVQDGGYDPVFSEPRQVPDGTQTGASSRREKLRRFRAQVEPGLFNAARTLAGGRVREARFEVLVHWRDLEARNLIDADGFPMLRIGDRLAALYDDQECLVMRFADPPGLYLTQTTPRSFSYGGRANLYDLEFQPRLQAR